MRYTALSVQYVIACHVLWQILTHRCAAQWRIHAHECLHSFRHFCSTEVNRGEPPYNPPLVFFSFSFFSSIVITRQESPKDIFLFLRLPAGCSAYFECTDSNMQWIVWPDHRGLTCVQKDGNVVQICTVPHANLDKRLCRVAVKEQTTNFPQMWHLNDAQAVLGSN